MKIFLDMRRSINTANLLTATLSAVVVLVACSSEDSGEPSGQDTLPGIDVVTTIYPVTYFTERVGGDLVGATSLLKPGVPAHDFEPDPSDIIKLAQADLVVYNHSSFEIWVNDALDATANDLRTVVEAADIDVPGTDNVDPHAWLNPLKSVVMVQKIRDGLSTAVPASADAFSENADELIGELTALNGQIVKRLATCGHNEIVVSHLAYGHLTELLSVRQIGLSGLSAESETGARRVAEVIDEMKQLNLAYILQEPLSNSDLAKTVAREANAEILELHPLEALTTDEQRAGDDYFTVMRRNIDSLALALDCTAS
jgi:zinc transport system substrate-binding protein